MPTKGVRKLLSRGFSRESSASSLSSESSSSSSSLLSSPSFAVPAMPTKGSYGTALMSERMSEVEAIITKREAEDQEEGSASARIAVGSLFAGSREDARRFFNAVSDISHFMQYFNSAGADAPSSAAQEDVLRSRRLLDIAMKRLQKEFFRILSANGDRSDSDSVRSTLSESDDDASSLRSASEDDDVKITGDAPGDYKRLPTASLVDLRSIANCMISAGYAKECVRIYKSIRKSIVDDGIYRLGIQRLSQSQVEKLDATSLEHWIRNWLTAARVVVRNLFAGERMFCDFVFGSSEKIKESCFAEITRDAAVNFLEFPGLVAATSTWKTTKRKSKSRSPSPERIFSLLDLHNCITDLWPEIEKIFSHNATSSVQSQAVSSLHKLGVSVRHMLGDLENAIQKDTAKEPPIPGGGLHPLTRRVMDVLVVLSDYSLSLDDIYVDQPLPNIEVPSSLSSSPTVAARFAWLLLVLLCNIDAKAELYKDSSLSYLFLANNLLYIVRKVIASKSLREVLGDEWVKKHEEKAKSFMSSYERVGWTKKVAALEEDDVQVFAEYGRGG